MTAELAQKLDTLNVQSEDKFQQFIKGLSTSEFSAMSSNVLALNKIINHANFDHTKIDAYKSLPLVVELYETQEAIKANTPNFKITDAYLDTVKNGTTPPTVKPKPIVADPKLAGGGPGTQPEAKAQTKQQAEEEAKKKAEEEAKKAEEEAKKKAEEEAKKAEEEAKTKAEEDAKKEQKSEADELVALRNQAGEYISNAAKMIEEAEKAIADVNENYKKAIEAGGDIENNARIAYNNAGSQLEVMRAQKSALDQQLEQVLALGDDKDAIKNIVENQMGADFFAKLAEASAKFGTQIGRIDPEAGKSWLENEYIQDGQKIALDFLEESPLLSGAFEAGKIVMGATHKPESELSDEERKVRNTGLGIAGAGSWAFGKAKDAFNWAMDPKSFHGLPSMAMSGAAGLTTWMLLSRMTKNSSTFLKILMFPIKIGLTLAAIAGTAILQKNSFGEPAGVLQTGNKITLPSSVTNNNAAVQQQDHNGSTPRVKLVSATPEETQIINGIVMAAAEEAGKAENIGAQGTNQEFAALALAQARDAVKQNNQAFMPMPFRMGEPQATLETMPHDNDNKSDGPSYMLFDNDNKVVVEMDMSQDNHYPSSALT